MTPADYYQQQLDSGLIAPDSQQKSAVAALQRIYEALLARESRGFFSWLKKPKPVQGLYLWGTVGVGKTFLMDCFYLCYPYKKMRLHFHLFLQRIHQELKKIQGEVNPLTKIAKKIALESPVICFDEFFVVNIADAMLLGELFTALFKEGVCLITTSNVAPDDLYKEGLQRERFLPVIDLIKRHTKIFAMQLHKDYRLTYLEKDSIYFAPLNDQAEAAMKNTFLRLAKGAKVRTENISIFDRKIETHWHTDSIIWFAFQNICGIPRSQLDYIEIAKQYHTVFISNIPVLQADQLNLTTAFIHLIDVFYDAHVRIVISAAASIEGLYPKGKLQFEFARTRSRLIEMQSKDYFEQLSSLT